MDISERPIDLFCLSAARVGAAERNDAPMAAAPRQLEAFPVVWPRNYFLVQVVHTLDLWFLVLCTKALELASKCLEVGNTGEMF
jgi:hypothetical protein